MNFIIQGHHQHCIHDFSWTLIQAINFLKWTGQDIHYILSETIEDQHVSCIPIGSVEFVEEFMQRFFSIHIPPLLIPDALNNFHFCKRQIILSQKEDIKKFPVFVKSAEKIKNDSFIIEQQNDLNQLLPQHLYQISSVIDIQSEWRCFIFKGQLVGLQHYLGDFTIFPHIETIKKMISKWAYTCPAYTIDVGINQEGTFLIECHDFFSCGLYGFSQRNILPYMFSQTFHWMKNHYK